MSDQIISTPGLEIAVIHGDQAAFVRLSGRLNIDSSPALRDRLLSLLQSEPPEAVNLDLTDVPYMDCSGIATLIEALKIARHSKTALHLKGLHGRLFHLFEVTGMLFLFEANGDASAQSPAKVR